MFNAQRFWRFILSSSVFFFEGFATLNSWRNFFPRCLSRLTTSVPWHRSPDILQRWVKIFKIRSSGRCSLKDSTSCTGRRHLHLKALTPVHVIYSRCFGPQTLLIWTIAIFLNEFWFPEKSKPITLRIIYRKICHCEISQKYLPLSRKGNGVEVDLHVTHVQW